MGAEAAWEIDVDQTRLTATDSRSRVASVEVEVGPDLQVVEGSEPAKIRHRVEEEAMAGELGHVQAEVEAVVFAACIEQVAPLQRHPEGLREGLQL